MYHTRSDATIVPRSGPSTTPEGPTSASSLNTCCERIMCVGMCVLDFVQVCECFPEEDTDRRSLSGYWQRGGNASNNCTVLRQLGAKCEFLGMLSDSPAFAFLEADCHRRGIEIGHCPHTDKDAPFSTIILVTNTGSRTIVHSNPNFPILKYCHFKQIDLFDYSWIHFEARNHAETQNMLRHIHKFNMDHADEQHSPITVSVEFEKVCVENVVLAGWADYVFLGKDLAKYLGWSNIEEAVHGFRKLLHASKPVKKPVIICAWGELGAGCLTTDDGYIHSPAIPPKAVIDSLGAGDTFCAAVIYALHMRKLGLSEALDYGNRCASFKLEHKGYDAIAKFENDMLLKS